MPRQLSFAAHSFQQIATRTHEPELKAVSHQVQSLFPSGRVRFQSRAAWFLRLAILRYVERQLQEARSPWVECAGFKCPCYRKERKDDVGRGVPKARADRWIFGSLDAARAQKTAAGG